MAFAYYNEFDKNSAAWLRQLIKNGMIADGEVDERSIIEVEPSDLKGFTQHHFFAGVGGWSYALRLAGWSDNRPVCTASLPCQPFSVAGSGKGKDDERHLLPHFIGLVKQCNFPIIFGEQVSAAVKHGWLDDLYTEMERENYAVWSIVLTAAGEGAPHIRQRLFWVADKVSRVVYADGSRPHKGWDIAETARHGSPVESTSGVSGVGNTKHNGHTSSAKPTSYVQPSEERGENGPNIPSKSTGASRPGDATNLSGRANGCSEWDNTEWLYCRDEKYRPIKPGLEPLVNGLPKGVGYSGDPSEPINADNTQEARVMRLKGYGNAIVPQVAAQFIKTVNQCLG